MREIKFRAYHFDLERMIPVGKIDFFMDDDVIINGTLPQNFAGKVFFELMQYTGLKDKNGKEIYEGDIVSQTTTDGKDFVVKWCDEEAGFNLYGLSDGVFQFGSVGWGNEIIGNIHENPELLT